SRDESRFCESGWPESTASGGGRPASTGRGSAGTCCRRIRGYVAGRQHPAHPESACAAVALGRSRAGEGQLRYPMSKLMSGRFRVLLRRTVLPLFLFVAGLIAIANPKGGMLAGLPPQTIETESFVVKYDSKGLAGISNPKDPYKAEFLARNGR